jgi:hypothetical protein
MGQIFLLIWQEYVTRSWQHWKMEAYVCVFQDGKNIWFVFILFLRLPSFEEKDCVMR